MPWWGKSQDKQEKPEEQKVDAKPEQPNPTSQSVASKLPKGLQKIVDKNQREELLENLGQGYGPASTDTNLRFAAYATRLKTILLSAHRYVAYTSDIGESFRPVAHPNLVRGAYGISWMYILGDVSYEGYKSYQQGHIAGQSFTKPGQTEPSVVCPLDDYRTVMVQRGIFQSLASMGLPAFTIHSVVRYSGRAMKDLKNKRLRTWGPIGLGLAVVPFLPSMFDEPVENAVEWAFHKGFSALGGPAYVGDAPVIGREDLLAKKPKEKEL